MLGGHHVIGAAIGFARDAGDERHRALRIGEEQLRAMLDEAAIFLRRSRQEARHINESDNRNFKRITKPHEARRFSAGIAIEHTRQNHRLIGHKPDSAPLNPPKPGDDIAREFLGNFKEIALINHLEDEFFHIIGLVGIIRDERIKAHIPALGIIKARPFRHAGLIVGGQEIYQSTDLQQSLDIIIEGTIRNRGFGGVDGGTTEFLVAYHLICHGFHHIRTGDIHIGAVTHHEDEIGHGGGIHITARARPHDHGNLRNHA